MAAPLERPARATLLRSFAGTVARAPSDVFEQLAGALKPSGADSGSFSTDPAGGLIVVQGGWWYRAEYRVLPEPGGAKVELAIVNVAQPAHWLGPITGRHELRAAPETFRALLSGLFD